MSKETRPVARSRAVAALLELRRVLSATQRWFNVIASLSLLSALFLNPGIANAAKRTGSDDIFVLLCSASDAVTPTVTADDIRKNMTDPDGQLKLPHLWSHKFPHPVEQD